jgi:hypothetical protein
MYLEIKEGKRERKINTEKRGKRIVKWEIICRNGNKGKTVSGLDVDMSKEREKYHNIRGGGGGVSDQYIDSDNVFITAKSHTLPQSQRDFMLQQHNIIIAI